MTRKEAEKMISEQVAIRKGEFGTTTIQGSISKKDQIVEFQNKADDVLLTALACGIPVKDTKIYKSFKSYAEQSELAKAMSAGGSHVGDDWIPTGFSTQLTQMIQTDLQLAALLPSFQMPQNPYVDPITTGHGTTYLIGENVEVTESDVPTEKVTYTAKKLARRVDASYELEEDASFAVIPGLKAAIAESLGTAIESALINGCTDATMDPDNTTATDFRRSMTGFRKLCIANSYTTDVGSFYADAIGPMRAKCGKFYKPGKMAWVVSVSGWEQLSRLASDSTSKYPLVITMDKLGNDATMKNGVLGTLFGDPVVLSGGMRDTMTADGYGTGTKTSILLVNRNAFKIGYKGGVTAESFRAIEYQTTKIVSTQRIAMMPQFPIASNHACHLGINIAV